MKKVKFIALLLCAFSLVAFVSCEKDDDDNVNQNQNQNGNGTDYALLLGTWEGDFEFDMDEEKGDKETLHMVLTIDADGVGSMSTSYMLFPLDANMTWTRSGDDITFRVDLSAYSELGLGVEELPARIKSLSANQLILIMYPDDEDAMETTWTRVD